MKNQTDQVEFRDLMVEYAICMQRLGGRRQALQLLKRSDLASSPEGQLGQAFVFMSEWDYEAAEQILRVVLSNPELSEYQRQIARLNLFASRVAMDALREDGESDLFTHLQNFDEELVRSKSIRLQAAVRELEAQLAIARSNWKAALRALDRAPMLRSPHTTVLRQDSALEHNPNSILRPPFGSFSLGGHEVPRVYTRSKQSKNMPLSGSLWQLTLYVIPAASAITFFTLQYLSRWL